MDYGRPARRASIIALICNTVFQLRPVAETYIQSGNLVVDAKGGAGDLRRALEEALAAQFGFPVDVVVREAGDWARHVAANPFAGKAGVLPKIRCQPSLRQRARKSAIGSLRVAPTLMPRRSMTKIGMPGR